MRNKFTFGSWESAWEHTVQYCGCEIKQHNDGSITVKQQKFALSVDEISISHERKMEPTALLTESEKSQMRQRLGALNWRATQTAPWLLSTVVISKVVLKEELFRTCCLPTSSFDYKSKDMMKVCVFLFCKESVLFVLLPTRRGPLDGTGAAKGVRSLYLCRRTF